MVDEANAATAAGKARARRLTGESRRQGGGRRDVSAGDTEAPVMPAGARDMHPLIDSFRILDAVRRTQGRALGAAGFDPAERAYRELAKGDHWRLRRYAGTDTKCPLLIVAAPIKRPYIWDLAPTVSAIRHCSDHGLQVFLVEWIAPADSGGEVGLDECVKAVAECTAAVAGEFDGAKPFLIGHSLGGTLAAICAGYESSAIRGLVLLAAPLCFEPATSSFRDALVSLVPSDLPGTGLIPGSVLSHAAALAAPRTFVWSRLVDAAMSLGDLRALDIHARVERWVLDEVPLPGKLVDEILERLYRENRFCRGTLTVRGRSIGPSSLEMPTLIVANTDDEIAPLASIEPLLGAMPTSDVTVIRHSSEIGVAFPHLAILAGREAFTRVWPEILAWLESHCEKST